MADCKGRTLEPGQPDCLVQALTDARRFSVVIKKHIARGTGKPLITCLPRRQG